MHIYKPIKYIIYKYVFHTSRMALVYLQLWIEPISPNAQIFLVLSLLCKDYACFIPSFVCDNVPAHPIEQYSCAYPQYLVVLSY